MKNQRDELLSCSHV